MLFSVNEEWRILERIDTIRRQWARTTAITARSVGGVRFGWTVFLSCVQRVGEEGGGPANCSEQNCFVGLRT